MQRPREEAPAKAVTGLGNLETRVAEQARLSAAALPAWNPTLNEAATLGNQDLGGLGKAVGCGNLFTSLCKLMTCVPGTQVSVGWGAAVLYQMWVLFCLPTK